MQLQAYHSPLPFVLDRDAHVVLLPGVDLDEFDPQVAITMSAATKLMRGRTRTRLGDDGRERLQLQHVALGVARRWTGRGWHVELADLHGAVATYTLRLPALRLSGQLLTMTAWVLAFERARARLSARGPRS